MKIVKRISYLILIICLLSVQASLPEDAFGQKDKTLNEQLKEFEELKAELRANESQQAVTKEEIGAAREEIAQLSQEQEDLEKEIETLNEEISQLEKDIISKNDEMKNIISYYQLSSTGEDAYLEYLFTATDFTDFIYRMSIAEQLSDYNDTLIDEYTDLIKENENKKEEASAKMVELEAKTKELESRLIKLNSKLETTMEGAMSIEQEIEVMDRLIKNLKEEYNMYKCDYNLTYDECIIEALGDQLYDTKFYRPLQSGRVSSVWGPRSFTLGGRPYSDFHRAVDFSTSRGSKVYAAANGQVKLVINAKASYDKNHKNVCGGNKIYIIHIVDGKKYTTAYYHLKNIKVKEGDLVTHNTVIATVGGTSYEYWDNCSTGAHLHFQVAPGHYGDEFKTYSGFNAASINPKKVINYPSSGSPFSGR